MAVRKKNSSQTVVAVDLAYCALSLGLTPSGHLQLYHETGNEAIDYQELLSVEIADKLRSFFELNDAVGLLRLGLTHFVVSLPSSISFWQTFSHLFIAEVCKHTASFE